MSSPKYGELPVITVPQTGFSFPLVSGVESTLLTSFSSGGYYTLFLRSSSSGSQHSPSFKKNFPVFHSAASAAV